MMSMQSSTHSSQMNTVGPAMSLRTSCWDLPQNEQYKVFFESPDLLMRTPAPDSRGAKGRLYPPAGAGDKNCDGSAAAGGIFWRRAALHNLIDETKIPAFLGRHIGIAFQLPLDRLDRLAGVAHVDFVQTLPQG